MFNSTWGNTHKPIPLHCPSVCGHRQFNASIISQMKLKNDSWYIQWLRSKGNRLFDLENQLITPYFNGSIHDYALMEDHKRHLKNDTSVLHFYFGQLRSDKKRAIDPSSTQSMTLFSFFLDQYNFSEMLILNHFRQSTSIGSLLVWSFHGLHGQPVPQNLC